MIWLRLALAGAIVAATWWGFGRATRLGTSRPLPGATVTTMNWMRGLAAVSVLLGHVRGLYLQDYEALRSPSPLWKLFYVVSGLGHQAVIVFFILSGFLVGSTVLAQNAEKRWNFRDYLTRRLVRLYVVLLPGLLLTLAWDGIGCRLFGTDGLYGGHLAARYLSMPDVRVTLSFSHFFGNLFFLQHLFIAPFGTNGPLWSLSYELWAYLLFPLLVRAGLSSRGRPTRLLLAALAFAILCAGGLKLDLYFGVWLLGAAVALWWRRTTPTPRTHLMAALAWLAFGACVLLGRSGRVSDWYADPILGVAMALLLVVLLRVPSDKPTSATSARAGAWLANFSYTLYVAHYPVLAFFFAGFMGGQRWVPSLGSVARALLISLAVLLLYTYPLSLVTEAHTDAIRLWLSRRKDGRAAASRGVA